MSKSLTAADAVRFGRDVYEKVGAASLAGSVVEVMPALSAHAQATAGLDVEVRKVSMDPKICRGRLIRFKDKAEIEYSGELNDCTARWVVCKELMHLLFDTASTYITSVERQIALAIRMQNESDPTAVVDSEVFALMATFEYLVPYSKRPSAAVVKNTRLIHLATSFKVPRANLDEFYSLGHGQMSDRVNALVPASDRAFARA